MYDELISIVVPVFNVQNYLERCLNSILGQTYENLEIILVDDGSTDGSGEICDKYADRDSRIRVIHQTNAGLSAARNKGILSCRGEYVALIDSDDFIDRYFLQILFKALKDTNADIACCEMLCFLDGNESDVYKYWNADSNIEVKETAYHVIDVLEMALYQHISITGAQQKLYRKALFKDILFPEGRYYEDLATTYQFFLNSNCVSVIDKKLYAYRIRHDSIMNQSFNERKMDCVWVAEKLFSDITMEVSQLYEAAACAAFRINRLVFNQIPFRKNDKKQIVWKEIMKYRKIVLLDKKVQKYERLLALSSYGGQLLFSCVLTIFRILREFKIKQDLK